jgi:hypothetical protein
MIGTISISKDILIVEGLGEHNHSSLSCNNLSKFMYNDSNKNIKKKKLL